MTHDPTLPWPSSGPPTQRRETPIIWTIGYTGRTIDGLERLLNDTTDGVVVDVRFKPSSRQAQFKKSVLASKFGDRYLHIPELGNRNYRGGPIEIVNLRLGIVMVKELLANRHDVMLMCVCRNPEECHRTPVALAVQRETGCTISQIM